MKRHEEYNLVGIPLSCKEEGDTIAKRRLKMAEEYIAYDDEGTFYTGTKRQCLDSIVKLFRNGDLDNVYRNRNQRFEISNYFSRKHEDSDKIEMSGFTVERTHL